MPPDRRFFQKVQNPWKMLEFLRYKASDRKRQLVAVAGCRAAWDRMPDNRPQGAVEVAELFARRRATARRLILQRRLAN